MRRLSIFLIAAISLIAAPTFDDKAAAQTGGPPGVRAFTVQTINPIKSETTTGLTQSVSLIYAAKCVCGRIPNTTHEDPNPQVFPLGPATYLTAISVYNPSDSPLQLTKRAASSPLNNQPGVVGNPVSQTLGPRQSIVIDCSSIATLLSRPPFTLSSPFLSGFVEITVSKQGGFGQLTGTTAYAFVTAAYTACNLPAEGEDGGCGGGDHTTP
jgi:hypothetical protein